MNKIRKLKAERAERGGEDQPSQSVAEKPISKLKAIQLSSNPHLQKSSVDKLLVNSQELKQVPVNDAPANTNQLEQYQAAMVTDVQRLSTKGTLEEKAELKKSLLEHYLPFVNSYVAAGDNYPNSVAVWVMVWLFDIGDIENALKLGFYLVKTPKQTMPEKFNSTMETFLCDYTYDWASVELKEKRSASPYLDQVVAVLLADKWELAVPVKSKMLNMLAKHEFFKGNFKNCVHWCDACESVNPEGHGTIGLKAKALKEIEKLEPAAAETK